MAGTLRGERITKDFPGGTRALDGVTFSVDAGRVLTLLGPSGCGKSTLLRIVAGLETATAGSLTLDGESLTDVPAGRRDVGFVFQNYALYPHLSVERNLSLALETRKVPRGEISSRVGEVAKLLGIGKLLERRPRQLSGGEQQRVALGRALVRRPRIYLMDEPLSNLDALLREGMRSELRALFGRLGATVVYVTHDQGEALALSDEILLMKDGKALQSGPPLEIYRRPADVFAATFVGSPRMTIWRGVAESGTFEARGVRFLLPDGIDERELCVGIRPEDVETMADASDGSFEATVTLVEHAGDRDLVSFRAGEEILRALAPPRDWPQKVRVRVPREKLHVFSATTERRIDRPVR
ncbi:MAG TPA: ABC transporter ATP-binding protein [Thermoanaerobaculia bacterium]|nr:ABC transporter ATP-binding protein [Thermoanaerobaculia bacterium]